MYQDYKIKLIKQSGPNNGMSENARYHIGNFVKAYHYSNSLSCGNKKVFTLFVNNTLLGVACFGYPVGRNCIQKYGNILELKRFVLAPGALKNTASWFIAKCVRELKKTNYDAILSYADPDYGHEGTIYKASNFNYLGQQKQGTMVCQIGNNKVHARQANKNYNRISYKAPKHIYLYKLKGK